MYIYHKELAEQLVEVEENTNISLEFSSGSFYLSFSTIF